MLVLRWSKVELRSIMLVLRWSKVELRSIMLVLREISWMHWNYFYILFSTDCTSSLNIFITAGQRSRNEINVSRPRVGGRVYLLKLLWDFIKNLTIFLQISFNRLYANNLQKFLCKIVQSVSEPNHTPLHLVLLLIKKNHKQCTVDDS